MQLSQTQVARARTGRRQRRREAHRADRRRSVTRPRSARSRARSSSPRSRAATEASLSTCRTCSSRGPSPTSSSSSTRTTSSSSPPFDDRDRLEQGRHRSRRARTSTRGASRTATTGSGQRPEDGRRDGVQAFPTPRPPLTLTRRLLVLAVNNWRAWSHASVNEVDITHRRRRMDGDDRLRGRHGRPRPADRPGRSTASRQSPSSTS